MERIAYENGYTEFRPRVEGCVVIEVPINPGDDIRFQSKEKGGGTVITRQNGIKEFYDSKFIVIPQNIVSGKGLS